MSEPTLTSFYANALLTAAASGSRATPDEASFFLGALSAVRLINRGKSPTEIVAEIDARSAIAMADLTSRKSA